MTDPGLARGHHAAVMADEDIEILDEMASYRHSMAGTGRVIAALERSGHPQGSACSLSAGTGLTGSWQGTGRSASSRVLHVRLALVQALQQ